MTETTTTPAASPTTVEEPPEFPVVWSDPADRERSWAHDDMHSPFCLTPLSQDYTAMIGIGFDYRYERLEVPISMRAKTFNGYLYFSWMTLGPESEGEAISQQYVANCRLHTPLAVDYWARAVPELRQLYGWIASVDVETLPSQELAEAWEGAWERAQRAWAIHFYAITGPYQVMDDLADLYESVIEKPPPGEAMRLIGGTIDELVAVDAGLGRLAELAATSPAAREAIRSRPAPSFEELATLPGGEAFVSELRHFLAEHGHLGQGFDDLALASWGEEPEMLLAEVAKRIEHPIEPAMERAARLAHEAERLADWRPGAARRPARTAGGVRAPARARPADRFPHRGPQLLDRPDGPGEIAGVRDARGRAPGARRRDRASRRRAVPAPRRGPGPAPLAGRPPRRRGRPTGRASALADHQATAQARQAE